MKILAYSVLNSVTQNTIKTLVFRKNTQDIQQVRKNMAAVLTAPATQDKPSERAVFSLYIKHLTESV